MAPYSEVYAGVQNRGEPGRCRRANRSQARRIAGGAVSARGAVQQGTANAAAKKTTSRRTGRQHGSSRWETARRIAGAGMAKSTQNDGTTPGGATMKNQNVTSKPVRAEPAEPRQKQNARQTNKPTR